MASSVGTFCRDQPLIQFDTEENTGTSKCDNPTASSGLRPSEEQVANNEVVAQEEMREKCDQNDLRSADEISLEAVVDFDSRQREDGDNGDEIEKLNGFQGNDFTPLPSEIDERPGRKGTLPEDFVSMK